jgi:hypothetical protein
MLCPDFFERIAVEQTLTILSKFGFTKIENARVNFLFKGKPKIHFEVSREK